MKYAFLRWAVRMLCRTYLGGNFHLEGRDWIPPLMDTSSAPTTSGPSTRPCSRPGSTAVTAGAWPKRSR